MASATLPFLHFLFCRPGPKPIGRDVCGGVVWRCSCGACWTVPPGRTGAGPAA